MFGQRVGYRLGQRDALEATVIRRLEKNNGAEGKWPEWLFNLMVDAGQASGQVVEAMEPALKADMAVVTIRGVEEDVVVEGVRERFGGELFQER